MNSEKLLEKYEQLKVIDRMCEFESGNVTMNYDIVSAYISFLEDVENISPGLLVDFKINRLLVDNTFGTAYYPAVPVQLSVGQNLAILKVKATSGTKNLAIQEKNFDFVDDQDLRDILIRDYRDLQKNLISESWKASIVLAGGSIEALLLDALLKIKNEVKKVDKAPKGDLYKWTLNDLITISLEMKIISKEILKLSDSVRDFRNLIHPGKEIRSNLKVEPDEARISFHVLNVVIRELTK